MDYIEADSVYTTQTTQSGTTYGLDRISHKTGYAAPYTYDYDGATAGAGITVYVVDTGVYIGHSVCMYFLTTTKTNVHRNLKGARRGAITLSTAPTAMEMATALTVLELSPARLMVLQKMPRLLQLRS